MVYIVWNLHFSDPLLASDKDCFAFIEFNTAGSIHFTCKVFILT